MLKVLDDFKPDVIQIFGSENKYGLVASVTKIVGPVKIGDNVTIGQNCVITKDIPSNSMIVK